MDDRGEKIVNLAREMLRADMVVPLAEPENRRSVSFKILCMATLLTALGSSAVTEWVNKSHRPISRYERVELDALVFYAARLKGLDEAALRRDLENHLSVGDFGDLTEGDFINARRYLQSKID